MVRIIQTLVEPRFDYLLNSWSECFSGYGRIVVFAGDVLLSQRASSASVQHLEGQRPCVTSVQVSVGAMLFRLAKVSKAYKYLLLLCIYPML